MGLFKFRTNEAWKRNYIKEFNDMRSEYERVILDKQHQIELLEKELEEVKQFKASNLKPKEKQIKDSDIDSIKNLRNQGLSYKEISDKTNWSKATVCRVVKGLYD